MVLARETLARVTVMVAYVGSGGAARAASLLADDYAEAL